MRTLWLLALVGCSSPTPPAPAPAPATAQPPTPTPAPATPAPRDRLAALAQADARPPAVAQAVADQGVVKRLATADEVGEQAPYYAALKAGAPALQKCYDAALGKTPGLKARVQLHLEIAPSGKLEQVETSGAGVPADMLRCVKAAVRAMTFPAGAGGTFEVPFTFVTQK